MDINITGYIIIRMNLPEEKIILMELKAFGVMQKEDYINLMELEKTCLFCI